MPSKKKPHQHRYINQGKIRNGKQRQKCRCGRLRIKRTRCFMFHDWRDSGRPRFGTQKQKCAKCGAERDTRVRSCWLYHQWKGNGGLFKPSTEFRCKRCGKIRVHK